VSVLNDGDNPSDHLAITCSINVNTRTTEPTVTGSHSNTLKNSKLNWNAANLDVYINSVCALLNHIDIHTDTLLCQGACNSAHNVSLKNIIVILNSVCLQLPLAVYQLLKRISKDTGGLLNWMTLSILITYILI